MWILIFVIVHWAGSRIPDPDPRRGVWISQRAITQTARAPLRAHARGSSPMILFVFRAIISVFRAICEFAYTQMDRKKGAAQAQQ